VSSHLAERFVEREVGERHDARCPDGEVIDDEGNGGEAGDDRLGAAGTTDLLTLERKPNHEVTLDRETDHVPDRQETGDVGRVDEQLTPAVSMIHLPHTETDV